jgi:hypothetical protein
MSVQPFSSEGTLANVGLDFPRMGTGEVVVGGSIIGKVSNIHIETDAALPYEDALVVTSFNEQGYGTCEPYSLKMVDKGLCADFVSIGDPIYVNPQRWPGTSYDLIGGNSYDSARQSSLPFFLLFPPPSLCASFLAFTPAVCSSIPPLTWLQPAMVAPIPVLHTSRGWTDGPVRERRVPEQFPEARLRFCVASVHRTHAQRPDLLPAS